MPGLTIFSIFDAVWKFLDFCPFSQVKKITVRRQLADAPGYMTMLGEGISQAVSDQSIVII